VHLYQVLVAAAIATKDLQGAGRWAREAKTAADRLGLDARRAQARRAQAMVLLARGEAERASEHALAAAAAAGRARLGVEAARALTVAARAQAQLGDTAGAQELDAQARALAPTGLLGPTVVSRPAAGGLPLLSIRERQMAELAATYTNRQIADQLGVSEKTVEATLRNAFAKLGVNSRGELAELMKG